MSNKIILGTKLVGFKKLPSSHAFSNLFWINKYIIFIYLIIFENNMSANKDQRKSSHSCKATETKWTFYWLFSRFISSISHSFFCLKSPELLFKATEQKTTMAMALWLLFSPFLVLSVSANTQSKSPSFLLSNIQL